MSNALMEKATMFAKGRSGAVKRCGDPDDCFREGWFPTVAGKLVNAGEAHPTPRGGFLSRTDALDAARTYKRLCSEYIAERTTT